MVLSVILQALTRLFSRCTRVNRPALAFSVLSIFVAQYSFSNENTFSNKKNISQKRMEEVVVTAIQPTSLIDMPRSVNVITRIDIERSGTQTIQDILARQANITLNSFSGNGKFSRVDIRGSGDTSTSNILVLVDGIRINTPDLNGAEFSIVPLNQIERIEVVRGGNSVRYGNGASQGVINIITRRIQPGIGLQLSSEVGSHRGDNNGKLHKISRNELDTANNAIGAQISTQQHAASIHYDNQFSEGYREHNQLKAESWLLRYRWQPALRYEAQLVGRLHNHAYELPGPLSISELRTPTYSNPATRRSGTSDDSSVSLTQRWRPSESLELTSSSYYRDQYNDFWPELNPANTVDEINLISRGTDIIAHWQPFSDLLKVSVGYEYQEDRYSRTEGGNQNQIGRKLAMGELRETAGFVAANFHPIDTLRLNAGYRYGVTRNAFSQRQMSSQPDTSSPDCVLDPTFGLLCPNIDVDTVIQQRTKRWSNEAFELGASLDIFDNNRIYASFADTFRSPNVDEQVLSPESLPALLSENLKPLAPQTAERYEIGYKFQRDWLDGSLGLFRSRTVNEIFFRRADNVSGVNINAPYPIDRKGIELSLNYYASSQLNFSINAGYIHLRDIRNKRFPLVAEQNRSLGIHYTSSTWKFDLNIRYIGERLDGNDFENTLYENGLFTLQSHKISDLRVSKTLYTNSYKTEFFFVINNLANEQYISTAYSQTVYPGNGRALFGGIKFEI